MVITGKMEPQKTIKMEIQKSIKMEIQKWIKMEIQNRPKWRPKIDQNGDPKIDQNGDPKSGLWGSKMETQNRDRILRVAKTYERLIRKQEYQFAEYRHSARGAKNAGAAMQRAETRKASTRAGGRTVEGTFDKSSVTSSARDSGCVVARRPNSGNRFY